MIVHIHTTTGGTFVAEIGDEGTPRNDAINATFDLIDASEVIYGHWRDPMDPYEQRVVPVAIRFERRGVSWVAA